ncbi:MAG: PilZ domain-containing protein [Nitrospirae bacterium]|nr:MAG: PilZ domain-containing protein [Nitrospirota bacterium]
MGKNTASQSDERRDLVRINDKLLLEYNLVGEVPQALRCETDQQMEDAIAAFIARPTMELFAGAPTNETETVLRPWLTKLDWVMALVLKTLAKMSPQALAMPRLTDVNVSGGGLAFQTERPFREKDQLDIRLILPPFVPILAKVEVIRVIPPKQAGDGHTLATRFASIRSEDRECLIRHVLKVQAEQLRSRRLSSV